MNAYTIATTSGCVIAQVSKIDISTTGKPTFAACMNGLSAFMGHAQTQAVKRAAKGEEKQFFFDKVAELHRTIQAMPRTYEQDGMEDEAVAYLHYFKDGADWYITEKDMDGDGTEQAFGLADLYGDGGELGYISIRELVRIGAQLDFHFKPQAIGALSEGAAA